MRGLAYKLKVEANAAADKILKWIESSRWLKLGTYVAGVAALCVSQCDRVHGWYVRWTLPPPSIEFQLSGTRCWMTNLEDHERLRDPALEFREYFIDIDTCDGYGVLSGPSKPAALADELAPHGGIIEAATAQWDASRGPCLKPSCVGVLECEGRFFRERDDREYHVLDVLYAVPGRTNFSTSIDSTSMGISGSMPNGPKTEEALRCLEKVHQRLPRTMDFLRSVHPKPVPVD